MKTISLLLLALSAACEAQLTIRNNNKDTSTPSVREQALQEHVNLLMGRLDEMDATQEKIVEAEKVNNQALKEKIEAQEQKIEAQEEKIQDHDIKIEQLTARLNVAETLLNQVDNDKTSQSQATFYARGLRSGYDSNAYSEGDILIYHTPVINPGGHYNKNTGEYTCPTSGVYMFVYSVYGWEIKQGYTHSRVTASLYREGDRVSRVYHRNDNNEDTYLSLSNSGLVSCGADQRVWVESDYDKNFIAGTPFVNVFGGVLLYTT